MSTQKDIPHTQAKESSRTADFIVSRSFGYLLTVLQSVIWWPIIKVASMILISHKHVDRDFSYNPGVTYLIVANHQSAFDHFMILLTLPWSFFVRAAPFRFMTLSNFMRNRAARIFLFLCGSFPSKKLGAHMFGIEAAQRFTALGHTVFIFPEGTRSLPKATPPRSGVTVLAQMPNVVVIPAHIQWYKRSHWRRWCTVSIGAPFNAHKMTPQEIMDVVYQLP